MDPSTRKSGPDSGFQRNMGYVVTPGEGSATVTLDMDDRHINRRGVMHGGVIMSMFDAAMGYAIASGFTDGRHTGLASVSITTNFMKPVIEGKLTVEAKRTGGGRKLSFCEARAFDDAGDLVATCSGTFRSFLKPEPASE